MLRFFVTLLILALPLAAHAQLAPPDGATVVSSDPTITFRWPGEAGASYFLQVSASRSELVSQVVQGTSYTTRLPAGPRYRWKVSKLVSGGYTDVVPEASFQLSSELHYTFDGQPGAPGNAPPPPRTELSRSIDGRPGGPGGDGANITVSLEKAGEYVAVSITGPRVTQKFLLDAASAPLLISSNGGDGGPGGDGADGVNGYETITGGGQFIVTPPGPGGNGGPGGDGGKGGDVTISAQGVNPARYVIVQNEGGDGGHGGRPGRGGTLVSSTTGPTYSYAGPAPDGRPGADGRPGRPGQVLVR